MKPGIPAAIVWQGERKGAEMAEKLIQLPIEQPCAAKTGAGDANGMDTSSSGTRLKSWTKNL
jgi:glycerol kinase